MSDLDPLMQIFGRKPPETVDEMRAMLETFAGFLNQGLPEESFHTGRLSLRLLRR